MMDRFNFRVWYKPENKYLDGIFAVARSGRLIIDLNILQDYDEKSYDCVIEQCTGLKDKNGNLIYEGDIVKGRYFNPYHPDTPNPKIKGVVCFVENRMTWIVENGDEGYDFEDCMEEYFEIIGNVHEQAEQKEQNDEIHI